MYPSTDPVSFYARITGGHGLCGIDDVCEPTPESLPPYLDTTLESCILYTLYIKAQQNSKNVLLLKAPLCRSTAFLSLPPSPPFRDDTQRLTQTLYKRQ